MWTYRRETWTKGGTVTSATPDIDVVGFSVEATDGGIGKVDEASYDVGTSYLVVDTGPWIFGKKVLLPAGIIRDVDLDAETVFVDRTKDEIKNAPEFDPETYRSEAYRSEIGGYYTGLGPYTAPETSTTAFDEPDRL
jgi:hypothetical protein